VSSSFLSASDFGQVTSTFDARDIQPGLMLTP
jgi:hypothetical protein